MKGEIYRTDFSLDRPLSRQLPSAPPVRGTDTMNFPAHRANPEKFMAMRNYIEKSVTFADEL